MSNHSDTDPANKSAKIYFINTLKISTFYELCLQFEDISQKNITMKGKKIFQAI